MIVAAFLCLVTRVHDGDGPLWCENGIKVRVAGIQAPYFENAEPYRRRCAAYVCSNVQAERSQRIVERLTLYHTLNCQPVGNSYKRVVARCTLPDGRRLSCAAIAAGAALGGIAIGGGTAWKNANNKAFDCDNCRGLEAP